MKKLLIIIIALLSLALPNFANDDDYTNNPETQQWTYNFKGEILKFEYDNNGKLIKIGNMDVTYLDNGQMDYIGDMKVKYRNDGKIKEVGKHWFYYDKENKVRAIGNFSSTRDRWGNFITIDGYWIKYEYVYPYGKRIRQLVKYY